jgi:hypothetical protein
MIVMADAVAPRMVNGSAIVFKKDGGSRPCKAEPVQAVQ